MACCKVCSKDISIGAHSIKAIVRHSEWSKHLERIRKTSHPTILYVHLMTPKTVDTMSVELSRAKSITRNKTQTTLVSCTSQYFVLQTEIMSKYSHNSTSSKNDLFSKMFSDSNIAKDFVRGKTKCSYIVRCALSPYFLELLNSELNNASHYHALFDGSYNNAAKEDQMDLHIRYWVFQKNGVVTRFYGSVFWEKIFYKEYLTWFLKFVSELFWKKILYKSPLMVPM